MNARLLNGVLAGALAVSLLTHVRDASLPVAPVPSPELLQLDDGQRLDLDRCCAGACSIDSELAAEIESVAAAISVALEAEPHDRDEILALGERLASLQADMVRNCVESALSIRGVLTPGQVRALRDCCAVREE